MRGIEHLIAMRLAGKRPDTVWINFDSEYQPPKYIQDWKHLELGYKHINDLRPFFTLDVVIYANKWKPEIGTLYEKLTRYADSIMVFVVEFEDDIGWWWNKERGKVTFNG